MRVIYKVPGEAPKRIEVENELRALQELVGGHIEHIGLNRRVGILVNDEGKLNGMEPNFPVTKLNDTIVGPAVFVGEAGEEFADLSDEDAAAVMNYLSMVTGGME